MIHQGGHEESEKNEGNKKVQMACPRPGQSEEENNRQGQQLALEGGASGRACSSLFGNLFVSFSIGLFHIQSLSYIYSSRASRGGVLADF